jgi:hypothetical protein
MNLKILMVTLSVWMLVMQHAYAKDMALNIKTEVKGQYFLVEKTSGTNNLSTLLVKRVTAQRSVYVKREFDCAAKTVRYIGSGESLDEMEKDIADQKAYPVRKNSISAQLSVYACSRSG